MSSRNITVIGAGFVGLTTAACLAEIGHHVVCSDVNVSRIEGLRRGVPPFFEPDLPELLNQNIQASRLVFTTNNKRALESAEFVFICLPTPSRPDGSADTSFIEGFFDEHEKHLREGAIVVMKSTVPVGFGRTLSHRAQLFKCTYVANPEFLREGSAVADFMHPDRMVLGSSSGDPMESVKTLYRVLDVPIIETCTSSAELIKYASNGFLSLKISFVNEIAALCEAEGIDIRDVAKGVGLDSRIGSAFLSPGPGWGGSCFPKDTRALLKFADDSGVALRTIRAAVEANSAQRQRISQKILQFRESSEFRVGVLGLTFKAGTDDLRDSPAIDIVRELIKCEVEVVAYDPLAVEEHLSVRSSNFRTVSTWQEAVHEADVVAILTEWSQFAALRPDDVASLTRRKIVVDARNVLTKRTWVNAGFVFEGVGV